MNYGIYANGLLNEFTSQRYMKEISTMTIVGQEQEEKEEEKEEP